MKLVHHIVRSFIDMLKLLDLDGKTTSLTWTVHKYIIVQERQTWSCGQCCSNLGAVAEYCTNLGAVAKCFSNLFAVVSCCSDLGAVVSFCYNLDTESWCYGFALRLVSNAWFDAACIVAYTRYYRFLSFRNAAWCGLVLR